jgi:hypothetical protein
VLHEVNPQHTLQANRRAAIAAFRVIRFDERAQFGPRHDHVHRVEEPVAPRALASGLESRSLIGCHRERLLLHRPLPFPLPVSSITHETYEWWT